MHHKFFDDWFQPGGHWESDDPNPWDAAAREVREETNVDIDQMLAVTNDDPHIPLDIQTHPYKARPEKAEPAHFHHDWRYVFLAKNEELSPLKAEVVSAMWMRFDDSRLKNIQRSIVKLRRMHFV